MEREFYPDGEDVNDVANHFSFPRVVRAPSSGMPRG